VIGVDMNVTRLYGVVADLAGNILKEASLLQDPPGIIRYEPLVTIIDQLLQAFKDIFLNFVTVAGHTYLHLSPLSDLQQKILILLALPANTFTRLADSPNPP